MSTCKGTESRFDSMSTMLGSGMSRRDVFKWVGASVLSAALVPLGIGKASAQTRDPCHGHPAEICPVTVTCAFIPPPGTIDCRCFAKIGNHMGKCLANDFCDNLPPCSTHAQCKALGFSKCSDNCCNTAGTGQGPTCMKRCTAAGQTPEYAARVKAAAALGQGLTAGG